MFIKPAVFKLVVSKRLSLTLWNIETLQEFDLIRMVFM